MRAASGLKRVASATLFAAVVLVTAGCGGGPKFIPVTGKVYIGDEPVAGGETLKGYVVFHAHEAKGNTTKEVVQGTIEADGSFKLFTRDKEGAPPGWYLVTVDLAETKPNDPYYYKPKIDGKYLEKDKSGIVVEVVEKPEPGRYDIKIPAKGK